jgi:integrase
MSAPRKTRGVFQRGSDWWIRWACSLGHLHREKIGPKSLALTEYQKRKVLVKTQNFCLTQARAVQQAVTFEEAAQRYLEWAKRERPKSLTFRQFCLKPLRARFGSMRLDAITRAHVESYLATRRDEGVGPATTNRERSVLSHLFNRAIDWGLAQVNPVSRVEKAKEPDEKPRPLSPEEEARFLAALPHGPRAWKHWQTAAILALNTGMRLNELRCQRWERRGPAWAHAEGHTTEERET